MQKGGRKAFNQSKCNSLNNVMHYFATNALFRHNVHRLQADVINIHTCTCPTMCFMSFFILQCVNMVHAYIKAFGSFEHRGNDV